MADGQRRTEGITMIEHLSAGEELEHGSQQH